MRPEGSPEELERRRYRAIDLLKEGAQPVEVARVIGVDRRSVRRWWSVYRRKGASAVAARPVPGRPPKLDARQRRQLERALLRGAQACGFESELWSCPRVAQVVRREFGVHYHVDHVGRLLRSLGWSPQRPARRARERDEAAIRNWVKSEWPRVKKKRPA